jgi:radical SAM protein with 4Fe4S-binding SPASM domain
LFRYNYVGSLIERLVEANGFPLQLELHPGFHCGPFQCVYCYGKQQELCDGLISIDDYSRLLDDLMDHPPFIEISGIKSDPLSYPRFNTLLQMIKEKGFRFGIHTKGYFLSSEVVRLLNTEPNEETFVTIGIDSPSAFTFNALHGLAPRSNAYYIVKKNIIRLYTEKMKKHSALKINLAYLLFNNNSSRKQINDFIKTFGKYADVIRFSIPQVPNVADPLGFLDKKEIAETFALLLEYEDDKVALLDFQESEHDKNFQFCWAQRFNATIDKAGNVFPCPQVALKDYANLGFGNITKDCFWNIWNSEKRKKMIEMQVGDMKCRVCDRKDETINKELNKLIDANRFILSLRKNVVLLNRSVGCDD